MKIYSIYVVTNKSNNKSYVGFACNVSRRKSKHKFDSEIEDSKFYRAIRKYGWEQFEWQVICQTKDGNTALNELEPYFIELYDSYSNGYNSTRGGDGTLGYKHTTTAREKMKASWTVEKRANLSNFRKGKFFSSLEGKERSRLAHLGKKRSPNHTAKLLKIHQKYKYVTPAGTFDSTREASKHNECSYSTIRYRCFTKSNGYDLIAI